MIVNILLLVWFWLIIEIERSKIVDENLEWF